MRKSISLILLLAFLCASAFGIIGFTGNTAVCASDISGDVNQNGSVDAGDATLVLRYVVELVQLNDDEFRSADMNGDGRVTSGDASLILRYVVNGSEPDPTQEPIVTEEPSSPESNTLIVYFTWSSNTERMAQTIEELTGGTLNEIVPLVPYPEDYTECTEVALAERDADARPEIKDPLESVAQYDRILVGYPIWWHTAPMIIGTFLESYDLTGKDIYPFCQSASMDTEQFENSMEFVRRCAKGANVYDGLFARATNTDAITAYLTKNGLLKGEENGLSGTVPDELEYIPEEYKSPCEHPGTLQKLTYETWESFTYEQKEQRLTKEAWVYLPYGYTESQKYNVMYLSHGGWSNETTIMGTDTRPTSFKYVIDNAIDAGKIKPLIIVLPTYNNTSPEDSGNYSLAIELTDQFHNELVNDLIPAVEGKYSTYAENTTLDGLKASRDHRGFGGFSMGSVNTWCTFIYCLDYFRYFMPMSGSYSTDGEYMASFVRNSGHSWNDFFIFSASGTADFAYSAFKAQIMAMGSVADGTFRFANNEREGNLSFLEREGYTHGPVASDEYTYNGLRFFWNRDESDTDGNPQTPAYTRTSKISDVVNDPAFEDYGRLIFPVNSGYYSGETLEDLHMTWYNNIDPDKTVEIVNYMKEHAEAGDIIFYDIYSDAEKEANPDKNDTGLFFFKGKPGERFAVCNAGGGFAYVGAMHDSFPHALELSKLGCNAFALIYRPGWDTACEDLSRAISFIFSHADELDVDVSCYSLWGGSAGGRMAAYLGSYGTAYYGGDDLPRPGAVVMQYTGHSLYTKDDPPTYACVGTNDGIANWETMQNRLEAMSELGIPTEFHVYEGLGHGFGLGTGTVAEGWLNDAVNFWESQMG